MAIKSINVNMQSVQMGMNQTTDAYSRNIQSQIVSAQKQLQEISSNEDMTLEEKMKKRQEIQQQINDLNNQLRQHQMEQRREKQQAKRSSMEDMLGGSGNAGSANSASNSAGLSQASMNAMISADHSMKQAKVQGSVATKMEGKVGVMKAEIKQDEALGGNVEKKKEELADLEQKAQAATASQLSTLAEARKTMEKAAKADHTAEKDKTKNQNDRSVRDADVKEGISDADVTTSTDNLTKPVTTQSQQPAAYTSVDIRL